MLHYKFIVMSNRSERINSWSVFGIAQKRSFFKSFFKAFHPKNLLQFAKMKQGKFLNYAYLKKILGSRCFEEDYFSLQQKAFHIYLYSHIVQLISCRAFPGPFHVHSSLGSHKFVLLEVPVHVKYRQDVLCMLASISW